MEALLTLLTDKIIPFIGVASGIAIVVSAIIMAGKFLYKQAPPNKAMVITGPWGCKTIIGRGAWVIPIIQRADYMSLENIQADFVSKTDIPTKDAINVTVDAVANMSISTDEELLKIASSKFLGYSIDDIKRIVVPVLEGNIREIISQVTLKELIQGDKKIISEKVIENVTPNLRDMGLSLTTFNIQSFSDKEGVIKNLGIENTVTISKDAAKARAVAEQEIAVAQAEAKKIANDAQIAAEQEIAIKNNELQIKKSELQKAADIKKAEADSAYTIQQEEQRRTIEITTANANLAKQEKEIELKEREVTIRERELEAKVKKQAEAEKYATQQKADAEQYERQKNAEAELFERQKNAEAEKFEAEQKAEAQKAQAAAERFTKEQEAEGIKAAGIAEAEAISAKGKAEAEAIQAKAEAEAIGILKKAEAMKEYGDAAKQQMELDTLKVYYEQLPKIAEAIGMGYANVGSIKMFGNDSSQLANNIMGTFTQVTEGLKESSGIDLQAAISGFLGGKMAQNNEK